MMELLLDSGADVDAGTNKGHSPLQQASQVGQPQAVSVLLDRGATVDLLCKNGYTALHYACDKGNREVVQQLVAAGAAVNAEGTNGFTPLHFASQTGHVEVVQQLEAAGAAVNAVDKEGATALHVASACGNVEVAEVLLAAGADPGAGAPHGPTALHRAASFGHHLFLQRLLKVLAAGQGGISSSIDAEWRGMTALHCAVESKHSSCVEVLLGAGADPDRLHGAGAGPPEGPSLEGASPLHRAVALGCGDAVRLLSTPGNLCRLWEGKTPLHLALSMVGPDDWLIDAMGGVFGGMFGPLSVLSGSGLMKVLLDAGSPAGVSDADGNTALALAARSHNPFTARLVPAMVRAECRRYKQLVEGEEGSKQQQGDQQQDAGAVRVAVVDGVYALLVAAAAAKQAEHPAAPPAEPGSPASPGPADHPASQAVASPASGQGVLPGGAAAAAADPLPTPKHVASCLEVVLAELGRAEAASVCQGLLLRTCGSGQPGAGSPFHSLVYGLLHSGGWPEVKEQLMRRWRAASQLQGLVAQPMPQEVQALSSGEAFDGSQSAADQMVGVRAQALAAAGAGDQRQLLVRLDQLAGLQMAENLEAQLQHREEGEQAMEAEEGMWELLETLHRAWGGAQQQVLSQMQQDVADAVLSSVMAWEQAGGCGRR
jgi:ankyrin repeat protein